MREPAANNFIATLFRSPEGRKYAILGTLLLLLGLLVVRQVTNSRTTAAAAAARTPAGAGSATDGTGLSTDPEAGSGGGTAWAGKPRQGSRAPGDQPVVRWLSSPAAPLGRNLFAVKLDLFPVDATRSHSPEESGGFWDEVAKSTLDHADQQERKQEMLSTLQAQARALRVTSVLMGSRPRAVINGELVGEGDVVAGFRVLGIEPRRIVVEREGIRLEVTMH